MQPQRKVEAGSLDGTPDKRMFWSIISDYDLQTGVCELIDNAIDFWSVQKKKSQLLIEVDLDVDRQTIAVLDNAGGVPESDLRLLVAPGGSRNDPNAEVIGIFGVGGKRAAIALGEFVRIRTRYRRGSTFELDLDPEWLESPDWDLAFYRVPEITPATTNVEISHLRKPFTAAEVSELISHLGDTYSWFLQHGCEIRLNGNAIRPVQFNHWAYPRGFEPQRARLTIELEPNEKFQVTITAGLITDRDPEKDNYGAYFYCNHRLVAKEVKTRDVGYYATSEAGVPHPDASLCRAIVELQGPAKLMPWNSSKSAINVGKPAFQQLRPTLTRLISYFSSLSRRLKHEWDQSVFPYQSGHIEEIDAEQLASGKRLHLPPLPRVNKPRVEKLKSRNKRQLREQPWTLGLLEAIAAADVISRHPFETKNRISLILLDSNFEIALKEFIVHRTDLFPRAQFSDARIQQLFKNRSDVVSTVASQIKIPQTLIDRALHYYGLRNKFIHERATVDVADSDIENYQEAVQAILEILFGLKFGA